MEEFIKTDAETTKWFKSHPEAQTTLVKCIECNLYYKSSLGHKCLKQKQNERKCRTCMHVFTPHEHFVMVANKASSSVEYQCETCFFNEALERMHANSVQNDYRGEILESDDDM